jgi:cytoskeletal protein CcmA (bactofilin family)
MAYTFQPSSKTGEPRKAERQPSRINEDISIVGDVKFPGELHIDGEVRGSVECASLFLGEKSRLAGNVIAQDVTIDGGLTGSIRACKVTLCSNCRVEAEIFYQHLTVEKGAYFEGLSRRYDDPMGQKERA